MATLDFQSRVIDKSFELPVVVDFWAAWCGPCQVLGPVITEMSKEANGNWELVKVDTEANREIAQEYQIMSIPNVKMFHKGEVVAEFAGALPRHQIQQWLDLNLPNPSKEEMKALLAAVRSKPSPDALDGLAQFVENHPELMEAQLYLHWFRVSQEPQSSLMWLQQHGATDQFYEQVQDIKALAELAEVELSGSEGFVAAMEQGREALIRLEIEEALKQLIQALMLNKRFAQELPRRSVISLFHLLGEGHPLSKNTGLCSAWLCIKISWLPN